MRTMQAFTCVHPSRNAFPFPFTMLNKTTAASWPLRLVPNLTDNDETVIDCPSTSTTGYFGTCTEGESDNKLVTWEREATIKSNTSGSSKRPARVAHCLKPVIAF